MANVDWLSTRSCPSGLTGPSRAWTHSVYWGPLTLHSRLACLQAWEGVSISGRGPGGDSQCVSQEPGRDAEGHEGRDRKLTNT